VRRAVGLADYRKALPRISSVAIAMQPVHRLQIRPIVHNYGASPTTPPSYIWVRAIVQACGRGQSHTQRHTDEQTDARVHNTFHAVYDSRVAGRGQHTLSIDK